MLLAKLGLGRVGTSEYEELPAGEDVVCAFGSTEDQPGERLGLVADVVVL